MKKIFITLFAGIISLALLASCNKESEDNGMLALLGLGAPEGSFVKEVIGSEGTLEGTVAIWNTDPEIRYMMLFPSSDIKGSGMISSISFKYNETQEGSSFKNVTIKMGHTSVTTLSDAFADNIETAGGGKGSLETVLDNQTVTIPGGNDGEYFTVYLSRPFNYNGIDNLILEINRNATSDNPQSINCQKHREDNTNFYSVFSYDSAAETGDTRLSYPDMKFKFAGGDNTQDYGGISGNSWPFNNISLRSQNLYLASDINGSGRITGIAFQLNGESTNQSFTYSMRFAHAVVNELGETFADNYSDQPVTVADNVTFTVPAGIPAGGWFWVPIPDGGFTYNGRDNMIVEVATTGGSGTGGQELRTTNYTNRRLAASGAASETGVLISPATYHIKLRFAGGTMDVITDWGDHTSFIFSTSIVGRLNLYRATELGSAGTITSIYCRLHDAASTSTTYANYQVIIGHSGLDSLVADPASDNFVDQLVAFDGSFTMPAGLVKGDWIEVPLSRRFSYDGTRNLAVWLGTTASPGASADNLCVLSAEHETLYPGHTSISAPGRPTVSDIGNYKVDMKFKISR